MKTRAFIIIAALAGVFLCGNSYPEEVKSGIANIMIESPEFRSGDMMPKKRGGNFENISPPLRWSGVPLEANSIALVCDDPDASRGSWVHWVIFNIPPFVNSLPEGLPRDERLESLGVQGMNDFKKIGYFGPTPPKGVHRYVFRIYALDTMLDLKPGASKKDLAESMKGHILAEGSITGRFGK